MSSLDLSQPPMDRLDLLYRLSLTFNSSLDLDEVLNRVMAEVIVATHAERGFVMLNDPAGQLPEGQLVFRVARGIDQQTIEDPSFQISRSVVERVCQQGQPILTFDAQTDERFQMTHSVMNLKLRSIMCAPLKIKDHVLGVVYVDNRMRAGTFTDADLELFVAIASSAASAVENARLYEEMELAYESTLEGWARALELRDHETQGHTRRVADMTIRLALAMGFEDQALVHVRRGALLHDIGKMGIPDRILLKPGPLDPQERDTMQKHPQYAYDMLWPIAFLRPALDIPYCHHERWDGLGYPRSMKEHEIPLEARIFAVVDVWDALRSNRPYRAALPDEDVLRYIQEQAGKHFDAEVVEVFMKVCEEGA